MVFSRMCFQDFKVTFIFLNGTICFRLARRIAHFVTNSLTYDMLIFQGHSKSFAIVKFSFR
jgi:hypothetical protein